MRKIISAEILTGGIKAFTLAEVLITLAIIGVVSALVIPSVLKNYNDKKYNTARLKALKTFGEAGKLASINGEINGQPSARAFVENVLSKYLKIVKVCDSAEECNFPSKIQPSDKDVEVLNSDDLKTWKSLNNDILSQGRKTNITSENLSIYIVTTDGYSAKIFYNPACIRNSHDNFITCGIRECSHYAVDTACINVIYDANGVKSPNHVGNDVGIVTVYWSGLNALSTSPGIISYDKVSLLSKSDYSNSLASSYCASMDASKTSCYLPDIYELSSLIINKNLTSIYNYLFWSSTVVLGQDNARWFMNGQGGKSPIDISYKFLGAWCVKR